MTPENIKMEEETEKDIVKAMLCNNQGTTSLERREIAISLEQEELLTCREIDVTPEDADASDGDSLRMSHSCSSSVVADTNPQTTMSQQVASQSPRTYSNKKWEDAEILSLRIPNNNFLLDPSLFSLGQNDVKTAEQREENGNGFSSMSNAMLSSELEPTPFPEPTPITSDDWSVLFWNLERATSSSSI